MTRKKPPGLRELIVLYDGLCGLCQRGMNFFRAEKTDEAIWHFVDIQSDEAKGLLTDWGLTPDAIHSAMHVLDLREKKVYVAEDAVAHCLRFCRFPWIIVASVMSVPWLRLLISQAYAWVSARRHRFLPPLSK